MVRNHDYNKDVGCPSVIDQLTLKDVLVMIGKMSVPYMEQDVHSVLTYPLNWFPKLTGTSTTTEIVITCLLLYLVIMTIYLELRHVQKSMSTKLSNRRDSVLFGGRRLMVRTSSTTNATTLPSKIMAPWVHTLQLNPEFVAKYCCRPKTHNHNEKEEEKDKNSTPPNKYHQIQSVGDYLATLQPVVDPLQQQFIPMLIQQEVEAAVTTILVKSLGTTVVGLGAMIPALPSSSTMILQNKTMKWISKQIAAAFRSSYSQQENAESTSNTCDDADLHEGGIPLSLLTIPTLSTLNKMASSLQSMDDDDDDHHHPTEDNCDTVTPDGVVEERPSSSSSSSSSSLQTMKLGEVGYEVSFGDSNYPLEEKEQQQQHTDHPRTRETPRRSNGIHPKEQHLEEDDDDDGDTNSSSHVARVLDLHDDNKATTPNPNQLKKENSVELETEKKTPEKDGGLIDESSSHSSSSLLVQLLEKDTREEIIENDNNLESVSSIVSSTSILNNEKEQQPQEGEETHTRDGNTTSNHPRNNNDSSKINSPEVPGPLIPNPFCVDRDWNRAIDGMIKLLLEDETRMFDPADTSLPPPTLINERLLPDLYLGWGDAKYTHTKRQILENRLLACLLNRLAYNYTYLEKSEQEEEKEDSSGDNDSTIPGVDDDKELDKINQDTSQDITNDLFQICLYQDDPLMMDNPGDFISALVMTGHKVEVCPRLQITTFGIGLCVKERDDSWTNLPLAFFLSSGFEKDGSGGRGAMTCMPHGGIDLIIKGGGPLLSQGISIQHYLAIEGLCGWHSNHNPDVPWLCPTPCREKPWRGDQAAQAVRMTGLVALATNSVATEHDLPFGGYGLVGVCNDSTAIVEYAMEGSTNVYPLTSSGSFAMMLLRRMRRLRCALATHNNKNRNNQNNALEKQKDVVLDIRDLNRLMFAMAQIGSDLNPLPAVAGDSSRRMLRCLPRRLPFQLVVEAKGVAEKIAAEYQEIVSIFDGHNTRSSADTEDSSLSTRRTPEKKSQKLKSRELEGGGGDSPCWNHIGFDSTGHIVFSP